MCFSGNKIINQDPINVAIQSENMGVGEILFNDVDNDGLMQGYNIDFLNIISNSVSINTIAVGGCGTKKDFYLLSKTNIS
ncbi:HisA/HisF-related TIM barrel protein, partial [Pelagibacteraceae bacterium]|nr:HisA/HisF-related TIM barrel protein [Pelagibacteraceae bacterium]